MSELEERYDELLEFKARQDAWAKGDNNPTIDKEDLRTKMRNEREYAGLKRAMEKDYENMYTSLLHNDEMDFIEGRKRLKTMADASKSKIPEWVLVTVNVDENLCTDIDKFRPLVEKYVNRKFITEYIYCFEQRSQTEEERGKGMHAHIIVRQCAQDGAQFKRDTKSSFNKVTKTGIRFDYIRTDVKQAIPYVKGEKKGKNEDERLEKERKVVQDRLWRPQVGLEDWYANLQT